MDKRNIVYGLKDPRNDLIYYVGKTTVGKKRPLQHLIQSHSDKVNEWVNTLQNSWIPVEVVLLEEVEDLNNLPERENYWVSKCKFLNPDLLNKQLVKGIYYDYYSEEDEEEFNNLKYTISKVGEIIARRRKAVGLTQKEVIDDIGISKTTLSSLETGTSSISINTVKKLLLYLEGKRILKASKIGDRVRHTSQ